jgi:hypothetical protein
MVIYLDFPKVIKCNFYKIMVEKLRKTDFEDFSGQYWNIEG